MTDIRTARRALIARVIDGDGFASRERRRAAFDNVGLIGPLAVLISKVVQKARLVTDEDVAAARASGLSEDQLFEMVVCAAVGVVCRQYDAALAALETAASEPRS